MGGFEDPYWNLIQTLAWGDRASVRRASDGVENHRTFLQEMQLPDGRVELVETPANPLSDLHLEIAAAYKGGAVYQTLDDAENALLDVLRNGRLNALGLENNMGDLLEIPLAQWAGLKFYFGPPRAGPFNIARIGATYWHGLKFSRSEVLEIWSDPFDSSVEAQAQPQRLETEHQRKGGRASKHHRGVQEFVDRLCKKFEGDGKSVTLGRLESWLTTNAPLDDGYEPEPEIPDFADVEYDEEILWWKDSRGQTRSLKKRSLEPYIVRAKSRDRGGLS